MKLLIRCKNLLEARKLAFKTLKYLVLFESKSSEIRSYVDQFLDNTCCPTKASYLNLPNTFSTKDLKDKISSESHNELTKLTANIINSIVKLRD